MTIHYECDNCGSMVHTVEALGQGVYDNDVRGRAFMNKDMASGLTVVVNLVNEEVRDKDQFCYACMWRHLKSLIDTMGPKDVEIDEEPADGEGSDTDLPQVSVSSSMSETSPIAGPFDQDLYDPRSYE